MKREQIEARAKEMISEHLLYTGEITPESRFIEDLGADSLDCVELTMFFEEDFGVSIADEQMEKVKTFKDAVDLIAGLVAVDGN